MLSIQLKMIRSFTDKKKSLKEKKIILLKPELWYLLLSINDLFQIQSKI